MQSSVQTVSASTSEFYSGPPIKGGGAELDATFAPNEDFQLGLNVTYTDLTTEAIPNPYPPPGGGAGGVPVFGNVLQAPKWAGSASLLYNFLKFSYGTWRLNLEATSTSEYFTVPNVEDPVPGYTLLNARLGLADVKLAGTVMDITLWGTNLADESYETYKYAGPGVVPVVLTSPPCLVRPECTVCRSR